MKTIVLPNYNRNVLRAILSLKVQDSAQLKPLKNQVLVELHASPINPSDIAFVQGGYQIVKTLPAVPGFEGSGVVVDVVPGLEYWLGKRVSFFVQDDNVGAWSEYLTVSEQDLIELHENIDMDQAACLAINPFTAFGLFDIALMRQSDAVIVNGAGGQVPNLIRSLASEHEVEVINIVRNPVTFNELKESGVKHVLLESDEDFFSNLRELSHKLNATVAFDSVAGPQAGLLFNAMPDDSELVVYGGLSNKPISDISSMEMIFKNKIVSGFNLGAWKDLLDEGEFEKVSKIIQDKFIAGEWKTQIRQVVPFDQITDALKGYLGNMSGGKVLLKPM